MGEDGRPDLINRDPNNLNGSLTVSIFPPIFLSKYILFMVMQCNFVLACNLKM